MANPPDDTRRPPGQGWTLGAGGLPKPFWGFLVVLLAGLGVTLVLLDYNGYGAVMFVLAAAAAVNLR